MSSMRALVIPLLVIGLCCSTKEPSTQQISDPGLDNRLSWETENATIAEGTVILKSPTGTEVAQVRQKLLGLKPHTHYSLSARVRALNTPSAQLSIDLFLDDGYDSPDQELLIMPDEVDATFRTYHRVLNTGAFPDQPYVRIFTFSTIPIELDELGLVEVK